jgi:hypothetical protein
LFPPAIFRLFLSSFSHEQWPRASSWWFFSLSVLSVGLIFDLCFPALLGLDTATKSSYLILQQAHAHAQVPPVAGLPSSSVSAPISFLLPSLFSRRPVRPEAAAIFLVTGVTFLAHESKVLQGLFFSRDSSSARLLFHSISGFLAEAPLLRCPVESCLLDLLLSRAGSSFVCARPECAVSSLRV